MNLSTSTIRSYRLFRSVCSARPVAQVKNSALKYIASDRIRRLAVARYLNEETVRDMNYDPHAKLSKAGKYIGNFISVWYSVYVRDRVVIAYTYTRILCL